MTETTSPDETWAIEGARSRGEIIDAVKDYARDLHEMSKAHAVGIDADDLERIKTDDGYLVFTVKDVYIKDVKYEEDESEIWYVSASIYYETRYGGRIEGSIDIYRCCREDDGLLAVSWHTKIED